MHFKASFFAAIFAVAFPPSGEAQELTADEIRALVDQRMGDLNPYQELLNDPDPARSMAAMQIMMESGDDTLVRMATEYGILSPNPTVKRAALESYLATQPILSIRFDGSAAEGQFAATVQSTWNGTVTPESVGYWRIGVGAFDEANKCFPESRGACFITVNSDGVFLTPYLMNGRATIGDDGTLAGSANLHRVSSAVPFTIQLID